MSGTAEGQRRAAGGGQQRARALLPLLLFLLAGCSSARPSDPPAVDFLLVSGDSTYWVTTGAGALNLRGSPLILAHYGGRFHEVYVADDDHSYADALLIGQIVYSRDLITNDSTPLFTDTLVGRIWRAYAAAHPDQEPLDPDEPVDDEPGLTATSEVTLLDMHGPYLSLEYHADTRRQPDPAFHTTWQAVVDMRDGHAVTLPELIGAAAADTFIASERREFDALLDSARASSAEMPDLVRLLLSEARFDPGSFTITESGRRPAVQFAARLAGRRDIENALVLPPVPIVPPAWWAGIAGTLPVPGARGGGQWVRPGYVVRAAAVGDTADSLLDVTVSDSARHVWRVGRVHAPLRHIFWLDRPPVDSTTRRALDRAFNEAVFYDDNVHVARAPHVPDTSALFHAAADRGAPTHPATRRAGYRRPTLP